MTSAPSSVARLAIEPLAFNVVSPAAACTSMGNGCCSGALRYSTLPVRPCAVNGSFCQVPRERNVSGSVAVPPAPDAALFAGPSISKSVRMSAPCSVAMKCTLPWSTTSAPISGMLRGSAVSRPIAQLRLPSGSTCSESCGRRSSISGSSMRRRSSGSSAISISAPSALTSCGSCAHSGLANSMPSAMMRVVRPSLTSSRRVISKCLPVLSLT